MKVWEGEGSVFIVTRSFEIYQELERLNSASMCHWLSTSGPSDDGNDGDARSTSTIQAEDDASDIGVLCLQTPQFSYEKAKTGRRKARHEVNEQ
jgi:hypothetical protein